jgi:hypothetical protein
MMTLEMGGLEAVSLKMRKHMKVMSANGLLLSDYVSCLLYEADVGTVTRSGTELVCLQNGL